MFPLRQIFLVLGLSNSGEAAAKFLLEKKATVYLYDDNVTERVEGVAKSLVARGAKAVKSEELASVLELCDVLVLSPGIPIDHALAVDFKRKGKSVIGETELATRYMRCPVLAVTGTNGKTTTVTMLTSALQKGGYNAVACGNIGKPMIECYDLAENAVAVAEISSFQLETLRSLCPHISVILNITEDHLNRHYNMENYIFLKRQLLRNATESEYAILNYDDPTVRSFAENTKAKVLFFSVRQRVKGAFYEEGFLWFGNEKIIAVESLAIGGLHNVQNALAVIAAAKLMGLKSADIAAALSAFKGIKHRVELVEEVDGVAYIDDSKGTNVDATLKAIEAMQSETIVLLGGKNKGYDYKKLFAAFEKSKVIHAVLYGENRYALLTCAMQNRFSSVTVCEDFEFAVRIAALRAKSGQTVLLSPASASFDRFANYEERGERFVEVVRAIKAEKQRGEDSRGTVADEECVERTRDGYMEAEGNGFLDFTAENDEETE